MDEGVGKRVREFLEDTSIVQVTEKDVVSVSYVKPITTLTTTADLQFSCFMRQKEIISNDSFSLLLPRSFV